MASNARAEGAAASAEDIFVVASEAPRVIQQLGTRRYRGITLEQHVINDPSAIRTWAASRASSADAIERKAFGRILTG